MSGTALRHFIEEALGRKLDGFDDWFPGCFHWRRLCADSPLMVARQLGADPSEIDMELASAISDRAERIFQFAHTAGLAVLAAAVAEDADPGETLELLTTTPDEGEERAFALLVEEVLGPLERWMAGEDAVELDDRGERSAALLDLCWPQIEPLLEEPELLGAFQGAEAEAQDDPAAEQAAQAAQAVLGSISLIGAMLATFRWQSVGNG